MSEAVTARKFTPGGPTESACPAGAGPAASSVLPPSPGARLAPAPAPSRPLAPFTALTGAGPG